MLDFFLAMGSIFDWISPSWAFLQDIVQGPSYTFLIPRACGWSGHQIEQLLRRFGVRTWGAMIVNDTFLITVRQSQARWAHYLLKREGIPLQGETPPVAIPSDPLALHECPHSDSGGVLGEWLDAIAEYLGLA